MKFQKIVLIAPCLLVLGLSACSDKNKDKPLAVAQQPDQRETEQTVVGRITYLQKNLFRYLRDTKDWSLALLDVPVTDGDILYSDVQGRSEFTFPNSSKIRINDRTKIQVDGLREDSTSVYLNSGIARFDNRGPDSVVKVETPFGQVLSRQPSAFDVYVGDSSVAVTALKGDVRFIDSRNNHYDVKADDESLIAELNSVATSRRYLDSQWDNWNRERDGEWQLRENNASPYLPAQLVSESQVLADNGMWESLNYNGETAHYWTPRNVAPDWSPFTVGQWTNWSGEQLWVPYERFGWVTHHHGGWVFFNNRWYWRPPLAGGWRTVPWYPARVAWVHQGRHIGWVPITASEVYYGRRYWGPRSVIYRNDVREVNITKYVNVNRTVIIDKDRLYSGGHRRYEAVRDVTIIKQVVNNGHGVPVVTRDVVQGSDTGKEHYFARQGDLSHRPRFDVARDFESRRRFTGANDNAQMLAQGIQKASIKKAELRTTQPLPFADKRDLPSTPQELRRQAKSERPPEASAKLKLPNSQVQQPGQGVHQQDRYRRDQRFERGDLPQGQSARSNVIQNQQSELQHPQQELPRVRRQANLERHQQQIEHQQTIVNRRQEQQETALRRQQQIEQRQQQQHQQRQLQQVPTNIPDPQRNHRGPRFSQQDGLKTPQR